MMTVRRPWWALALVGGLWACDDDPAPNEPDAAVAEGVFAPLGSIRPNATAEERATFERGQEVATRRFEPAEGLGPRFNLVSCAGCHENPHGDQFAAEMARGGCATCHQTTSWRQPNIAHDTWPLTGAHARAACDSCHHPTQEDREQGRGASYRGVPRVCEGCHEDDHAGQFRTSAPIRAYPQCHTTEAFEI